MATTLSNNFVYLILKKEIDFDADTFKIILMASGFVYNKTTHDEYADVSAYELGTANGYTAGGATLTGVAVARDDTDGAGEVTWNNATWNVVTAALTASGAIIYDDTVTGDPIIGYIDFSGNQTTDVGGVYTVADPAVAISS